MRFVRHLDRALARLRPSAALFVAVGAAACAPDVPSKAPAGTAAKSSDATGARAGAAESKEAPRDVRTHAVGARAWDKTLRVTGELAAFETATLSTEVAGRLEVLAFDVGTAVKKGDLLAQIETKDFELERARIVAELHAARAKLGLPPDGDDDHVDPEHAPLVEQAEVALRNAVRRRDRLLEASKAGAATQVDTDDAVAAVETATAHKADALEEIAARRATLAQRRAELAIADKELEDTRVVAPFDGVVRNRRVSAGDFLAAGAILAELVRVDPVRVRVHVPEFEAPHVHVGQPLSFTLPGETTPRTANLARVEPTLDTRDRTLTFEADAANPGGTMRPGSFVTGTIVLEPDARVLAVPLAAVTSFAGVDKVILVVDGKAQERRVGIGRKDDKDAEIVSGLSAGDVVVLEPGNLQTGASLRVVDAK